MEVRDGVPRPTFLHLIGPQHFVNPATDLWPIQGGKSHGPQTHDQF